jgi:hypothetical protein
MSNISYIFFSHQVSMKYYHFNTDKYGAHKAADEYLDKFNGNFDKFMEILSGASNKKVPVTKKSIEISSINDNNIFVYLQEYHDIFKKIKEVIKEDSLVTVIDDMINDLNQFKYLLQLN